MKKMITTLAFAAITTLAAAPTAQAIDYPSKPVHVIVPFSPGGGVDTIGRTVSQRLSERLGQPFVVENRPGANGSIGVKAAMRAEPDGYTLLLFATAAGMFPLIYSDLGYDPFKDIAPISTVAVQPLALFTTKTFPVDSVSNLIQAAKAKPNGFAFAGVGVGSPQHMAGELLMHRAGIHMIHVPYKGTAPALNDLVAGQTQLGFLGLSSGLPFVRNDQLNVLAVASRTRSALAPELPTMAEQGVSDFDLGITYFMGAPVGTPPEIIDRLNAAIQAVLKEPAVVEGLQHQGYETVGSTPQEVADLMREEDRKWAPIVKAAGIKAE